VKQYCAIRCETIRQGVRYRGAENNTTQHIITTPALVPGFHYGGSNARLEKGIAEEH
jgi:hypothetical protein